MRRRRPDMPRPFRAPWVPFTPDHGNRYGSAMMVFLPRDTWIRLVVWLIIGMVIYFTYGRHHSKVQKLAPDEVKVGAD